MLLSFSLDLFGHEIIAVGAGITPDEDEPDDDDDEDDDELQPPSEHTVTLYAGSPTAEVGVPEYAGT